MSSTTTISQYFRNKLPYYNLSEAELLDIAESPADVGLVGFELDDLARPYPITEDFMARRDYAESCLYLLAAGIVSGSGETEKIGDVSYSRGQITITQSDRARYIDLANKLRAKHGFSLGVETESGGMMDFSHFKR
jgi:hypothetical protein